jgi:hypothetical protein
MRIRFSSDDEPIDLRHLPPLAGTVLAKRLGPPLPAPPSPIVGLGLASLPVAGSLAAINQGLFGLDSWGPLGQSALALASAVPLSAVLANHLKKAFLSRTVQWPPLSRQFPTWNALTEALRNSPHDVTFRGERVRERDHLFLGVISGSSKPFMLHTLYANRPALVLGRTGAGKTKLVAEALLVQLIPRRFLQELVIDLKGDKAFMLGLAEAARRARVDFKWLTIEPGKSSYIWNFLTDRAVSLLSREQLLQILLKALNLVTGQEYGAGYFGVSIEQRARATMDGPPLRSMREFHRRLQEQTAADVGMSERDFANTGHLVGNVARVASADVLNAVTGDGVPEAALREAITLTDVLSKPGVTYFSLPALLEPTTALFVAKLLIHLLAAVARVFEGRRVPVLVWMDEAQEAVGPDLATPIRQARESDVTFWIGVQDLAALQTAQGDFTSAVLGNTPLKIFCTAEDTAGQDYIKQSSGERLRQLESVSSTSTRSSGRTSGASEGLSHQYREEAVPRIDQVDINRFNRDPNAFLVMASESRGFTQYRFPVVVRSTFPVSARTLARRMATPWPRGNQFTITPRVVSAAAAEEPQDDGAPEPEAAPQAPPPTAPEATAERPVVPPATQVPPAAAVEPERPRRRGRPRKVPAADTQPVTASDGTPAGLAPKSEMAEYLRRLAAEPTGSQGEEKR